MAQISVLLLYLGFSFRYVEKFTIFLIDTKRKSGTKLNTYKINYSLIFNICTVRTIYVFTKLVEQIWDDTKMNR